VRELGKIEGTLSLPLYINPVGAVPGLRTGPKVLGGGPLRMPATVNLFTVADVLIYPPRKIGHFPWRTS